RVFHVTGVQTCALPISASCSHGLAGQGTGQAARAASAGAELGAGDGEHLDPGVGQPGVGDLVALVGDDHAGRQRQGVVAVVPLFAFGGDHVRAGVDDAQFADAHGLGGGGQERVGAAHGDPGRVLAAAVVVVT